MVPIIYCYLLLREGLTSLNATILLHLLQQRGEIQTIHLSTDTFMLVFLFSHVLFYLAFVRLSLHLWNLSFIQSSLLLHVLLTLAHIDLSSYNYLVYFWLTSCKTCLLPVSNLFSFLDSIHAFIFSQVPR